MGVVGRGIYNHGNNIVKEGNYYAISAKFRFLCRQGRIKEAWGPGANGDFGAPAPRVFVSAIGLSYAPPA